MCSTKMEVLNFYEGKSILITGATGGIGKLLVEKLLRSCPSIENIYLLVRSKRGKSTSERATELFNTQIFDSIRVMNPGIFSKIVIMEGDLCMPDVGLSNNDRKILMKNISIVFHCAASLKFDTTLEESIMPNVFGTRRLLQLCHRMIKIEVFVHVSTLYSTCNKTKISECIPTIPALDGKIDFSQNEDEFIKAIPMDVANEWPNTYTFSKALAEMMLDDQKGTLPVCIVRPSVVLSTLKEPMPGWIDTYYGPTLSVTNGALGLLRSTFCDGDRIGDIVPSDMVVNLLICVGCRTKFEGTNETKVYNCCTGRQNPTKMKPLIDDCQEFFRKYPLMAAMRYPDLTLRKSYLVHSIVSVVQHTLLSGIFDIISHCFGRKTKFYRIHKTLARIFESFDFFATRQWDVDDKNVEMLNNELSESEKDIFYFDVKKINWKSYFNDYAQGIRKYLFKEEMDNIDRARRRMNRLYWIEKFLTFLLSILSITMIYRWIHRQFGKTMNTTIINTVKL